MAKLLKQMLNLVGWEEEDDIMEEEEEETEVEKPQFVGPAAGSRKQQNKVVNIHQSSQLKVIITQPDSFEEAQGICDHLKNKKPVIVNLEGLEKEVAQRIVDFLSGSVYALDGNIQKVANGIFVIAPHNVDIMGDFKDELRNKTVFPWVK